MSHSTGAAHLIKACAGKKHGLSTKQQNSICQWLLTTYNAWINKTMPYLAVIRPIRPSAVVGVTIEVTKDDIWRQSTYNLQTSNCYNNQRPRNHPPSCQVLHRRWTLLLLLLLPQAERATGRV